MVDANVERIASLLRDEIRYEAKLAGGMAMELRDLAKKLKTIRNVLDDAERRGVNELSVERWLKKLQNTAYEIDDILDEYSYSLLKHKAEASDEPEQKVGRSFIPSSWLCFKKVTVPHDISMKTQNVKVKIDQILKERDDFNFSIFSPPDHIQNSWKIHSTSSIEQEKVHGVDIDRKMSEIVWKLMLNSGDIQILSIVGMVGIGKTTLAQLIFNNTKMNDTFDLRIWVCVSHPFDVVEVARNIVVSVGREIITTNHLELILQKVKASISGRKFFLFLDDVWTEDRDKWMPLKIALQYGAPGSKILVTTRNEGVAKMMGSLDDDIYHPEELSDEECWSLLRDISLPGKSEEECGEFKGVGKKIARKCRGLPLAAIVLGRLLQFKDLEGWKHVEKSEIWQLESAKSDLFPHFILSYNELSPALKRCFSYCAVYPKDYQYHAESLIQEWMALGYLDSVGRNSEMELKGREFLNNLAMRFLFHGIEKSESGEKIEWCKMHDIVHDFALFVRENNVAAEMRNRSCQVCDPILVSKAQEYHSLSLGKGNSLHHCDCVSSVRILRIENGLTPVGMESLIHLRWLDFSGTALSWDSLEIICRFYFLQTLSLARCNIIEISREIGNLVHLRRLDLSWNEKLKELPKSMYNLVELRTLSLACCSLKEICGEIGNLVHLRRLDLSWNALKKLPKSMYNLVELRTLSLACCSLKEICGEIGNLVHLRRLDLSWNALKKLPKSMYSLVELRTLSLACCSLKEICGEIGDLVELRQLDLSFNEELNELPGSMYRLVQLQTLSLAYCSVEEIHEEIGNLVNLRNLDLSGNVLLKKLPEGMRHLVELRTLSLACCSLEKIGGEIGDLIRLTQLDLRWNRELKELPESICRLVELQILNIEGTKVHRRLPQVVGQLSNLTLELREFKVGNHYNKLGWLKKVKHSTGSLTLDVYFSSMSKMVKLVEDAKKGKHSIGSLTLDISFSTMSEMVELVEGAQEVQLKILFQELEKLKISFEGTMNGNEASSSSTLSPSSKWMELLEALEPHHELKQLTIWRYEGSTLPSWMSSPNNFIREISLHHLSEVSSLPALGKLPFLEVLYIDHLKKLKQVGREFLGIESASDDDVVAFPKLKELTFDTCPEWKEWEDITEQVEKSATISVMPCLTELSINFCNSLKKLPHRLLHKASSSLQMLDIEESSELVETYREDKEGSPWRSISQHNPQLELNL